MQRVILALAVVASAYPLLILLAGGQFAVGGAVIVGIVTVGASLLAGVPLAFWFVKRGWLKFWQSLLVGGGLGVVVGLAFNTFVELSAAFGFILKFVALGGLHTGVFWVLAFWRNQRLLGTSPHEASNTKAEGAA
jgi:hypothetical protein